MKSKMVAILLALFLGGLGIHKFYLGRKGLGILYLVFCWTYIPVFLSILDIILIASMSEEEFNTRFNATKKPDVVMEFLKENLQ